MSKDYSGPRKIAEFLKVSWMAFWRLLLLSSLQENAAFSAIILAPLFAFVLVFGAGYTVRTFPLLKIVTGKLPLVRVRSGAVKPQARASYPHASSQRSPAPSIRREEPLLKAATGKGAKTGYEPYELKRLTLKRSPWIVGDPGFGLDSSHFDQSSVKLGQEGERNFALALQKSNLIDGFQSFWSCSLPSRSGFYRDSEFDTDIDCILFNGETIFLVDLKNYKGGDVTYVEEGGVLTCRDNATGKKLSISSKRSNNMAMALERFQAHLRGSGVKVEARIVFMPTNSGIGSIRGVKWPGNIPALYLPDFLSELSRSRGFKTTPHHHEVSGRINGLVKR